jgi:eukaryotic-like serine/threonine-protein kinase
VARQDEDGASIGFDMTVADDVFDRAVSARWPTVLAQKTTIARHPRSTIEPAGAAAFRTDTPGRRALSGLVVEGAVSISAGLAMDKTIGEGGMGIVRLATQLSLGRKVAVKTLKPEARTDGARLRLLREAWVTGSLEHPNIVPVYDLGLDADGAPIIVLKRIEGVEWGALMRDGPLVMERFGSADLLEWNLRILVQVSNGVSLAHARGIVHRDLKPENVMIGEFGEVYVVDWGIAVSLKDDASGRIPLASEARDMAGTPSYMAPEMLGGEPPRITERTDVYLLGAMLFEILAGHPPHEGASFRHIVCSIVLSKATLPADVPPELAEICRRAMRMDPKGRYESAEALRFAVEDFLRHAGSSQLSREADARLAELRELLTTPNAPSGAEEADDAAADDAEEAEDASQRRTRIYNLFGACRFGFRQALRSWPGNEDAKAGLRTATEIMTEFEIARGSAENADAILGELDDPPAALVRRVKEELARHATARSRADRFARDHDPSIGGRTRLFLSSLLGGSWVVFPLVARYYEVHYAPLTSDVTRGATIFLTAIAAGAAYWGRESLSKTLMNRRLVAIVLFAFAGQLTMELGTSLLGLTPKVAQALHFFNYFVVTAMATLAIEKRLAWSAIGYLIGFFIVCANTDMRWWVMSACNLVLTTNLILAWSLYAGGRREPREPRKPRKPPPLSATPSG